jgi:hypothetical protein
MEVAAPPVMKADPDLQDAVIEATVGRARVAPQELERLVLLEELTLVELRDAVPELCRRRFLAARPDRLVDSATGDALWPSRGLALAAASVRASRR